MANPAKVAEWRALAPLAAGSAVMFHFRYCYMLQDISLLKYEAAALPRVGGLMPASQQF